MKRLLRALLCVVLAVPPVAAQTQSVPGSKRATAGKSTATKAAASTPAKAAPKAGLPPLIDREMFFGNPEIAGAQLSPDGKYISFLKPWNNTRNIYVKAVDEPFSAARLLTTEKKRPIPGYFWSRDSKHILYVKDNDGDENYNVYAVDPRAYPLPGHEAPLSRDLTGLKGVRVMIYELPKTQPDIAYIGLNDRDKAWHDLYRLKISTGEKALVRKNTDRITGWVFDNQGELRLATRAAENGDTEFLRVDADKFTKIYFCDVFETCGPIHFAKGNGQLYIRTNKGEDLVSLALLDPATGATKIVETDPLKKVDFGGVIFSDRTDELQATLYQDDQFLRHYFKDKALEADYSAQKRQLPGMEVGLGSRTLDESKWLVTAFSDTEPGVTYLYDRATKKLTKEYAIREKLPRTSLATMKVVRYPSSDGLLIPAYLTLPRGVEPKNLPALLIPHGGPWARDGWGYNSLAQFFANRGYVVLSPNFRGSTGYGKKFLDAGNLEWGRKMQDDVTWGVKYLVAQGIADPKRVGITGGSYGGYATLAGVTFTPDLYAAAVDIVGPSNLITLLESIPPYWEPIRKVFYQRMGDPNTPEGKKLLVERSPLTYAEKIRTPLLVAQGANDPRVNQREADQIVIALRDRGFPVEYLVAPDEGHGFQRPVNNLAMFMAAEKFLAKHLGGRYEEGGSAESVKRLAEITVDPKTVVLTKKVDAKSVGAPKPAVDLMAGTYNYKATIQAGAQQIPLTVSTVIKEEGGAWTAVDTMQMPSGAAVDTATLEKGTLVVKKREVKQGPVTIALEFTDNKVNGKMSMNGQERPVSVDLGGPMFADAAGALQSIGCLPLAEGYTTLFRNFDVQRQKEKLMELKVVGAESVTVPAGTFDSYKLELASADGGAEKQTMWVAKESRKPVKVVATLPNMAGATMTMELVP
jgi:dipeptidyl aminopeptidase/acylaminoacyl peptidase